MKLSLTPLMALWCTIGRASAFCSPTRSVGMVTLLASMGTQASAEEWEPIKGLKTTKTTVKASTPGAPVVVKGDTVTVHATGTVKETNKKFWSTKDPGQQPFTYQAGVGGVIVGWDNGLLGAALGETRKLDIPAAEGYGKGGFPAWGIPPNGGLFFEIEVLKIQGKEL